MKAFFQASPQPWEEKPLPAPALFLTALAAVRTIDAAGIARASPDPAQIPVRLHAARVDAVRQSLSLAE